MSQIFRVDCMDGRGKAVMPPKFMSKAEKNGFVTMLNSRTAWHGLTAVAEELDLSKLPSDANGKLD